MTSSDWDKKVWENSGLASVLGYFYRVSDGRSWSLAENLKAINPYVSGIKERVILIKYLLKEIILIHEVLLRSPAVLARLIPLGNMINATVRIINFFGIVTDVFYAADNRLTYTQITFASIATVIDVSLIVCLFLFPEYLVLAYFITSIYDLIAQNFLYRDAIATFDEKLNRDNCDRKEHFKLILEKSDYIFKKNNKILITMDICSVAFLLAALFLGSTPIGLIIFSVFVALVLAKVIVEKTLVNDYKNVSKELYDFCYKYEREDFSNMFQKQFNLSQINQFKLSLDQKIKCNSKEKIEVERKIKDLKPRNVRDTESKISPKLAQLKEQLQEIKGEENRLIQLKEQLEEIQGEDDRLIQLNAHVDQSSQLSVPSRGSVKVSDDLVNRPTELTGFSNLFCQMKSKDRIELVKKCEQVLGTNR